MASTVLKAGAHVARSALVAHATVVVGAMARSGRTAVGIHRSCGGSEARAGPGCGDIAFRLATGVASGERQGAATGAAGGQARRPVA